MNQFKLTPAYCLFNGVAVQEQQDYEITFLMEDIENVDLMESLKTAFENHVEFYRKKSDELNQDCKDIVVSFRQGNRDEIKKCLSGLFVGENKTAQWKEENGLTNRERESAAAVILLDTILLEAVNQKTSDVHIEESLVRFRVDGKLQKQLSLQKEKACELVQRIKLLSGMDVVENRHCQDGHFTFEKNTDHLVNIRVSSIPVIKKGGGEEFCESIVMRLLDEKRVPLEMSVLGFNQNQISKLEEFLELPQGLVLVCGATGSGKSTTVAALITEMNRRNGFTKKIVSIEDPPEYVLKGVTQIEVSERRENNFENILNHVFRQDPDVIFIGEIRDESSAFAALRASLTGHLVFATLHTASAGMSLLRLENLGLNRNLLASVLKGVVVQHLGYLGNEPNLVADVCVPKDGFDCKVSGKGESELEDLFVHCLNSVESLKRTLEQLAKQNQLKISKNELESKYGNGISAMTDVLEKEKVPVLEKQINKTESNVESVEFVDAVDSMETVLNGRQHTFVLDDAHMRKKIHERKPVFVKNSRKRKMKIAGGDRDRC